ncbi:MAG: hypothetical protein B6D56_03655 [Candidatus Omnitrophica bacterium 4484_70.1]|nr:MAG: hypothetical protein B6D56_03655 [Candidatus Omnitrophica bacterium 4484_70.1]
MPFKREKEVYFLLILSLIVGAFLHFRNLNEAVYLDPDEARAFTILSSGPLIYLICRPIYKLFLTESSVFVWAGVLGFLCIIFFIFICRLSFDKKIVAYATFFYTIFPFRINYARRLYPAIFVDFFFLLLLLSLIYSILKNKIWMVTISGFLSSALIFIHPFTYCILWGIIVSLSYFWYKKREKIKVREAFKFSLLYFLGFIIGFFILERIFMEIKPGYIYSQQLFNFHKSVLLRVEGEGNNLASFFITLFKTMVASPTDLFRSTFVISAVLFSIFYLFKKKEKENLLLYFIILTISGVGIFIIMAGLDLHKVRYRHFIWLSPTFSLCIAYFIKTNLQSSNMIRKIIIILATVIFVFTSFFESYMVTEETFKMDKIKKWLKDNNIKKNEILTFLHLYSPGDKVGCSLPPVGKAPSYTPSNEKYLIIWPLVYRAYTLGLCKYIIPSGIGAHAHLEEDDVILKNVRPLVSWPHPYYKFKYRFFGSKVREPTPLFINFYRLKDVFSKENFLLIIKEKNSLNLQSEKVR